MIRCGFMRKNKSGWGQEFESDDQFAFIVGFTENGVPYGITHEEWENSVGELDEENKQMENEHKTPSIEDIPF